MKREKSMAPPCVLMSARMRSGSAALCACSAVLGAGRPWVSGSRGMGMGLLAMAGAGGIVGFSRRTRTGLYAGQFPRRQGRADYRRRASLGRVHGAVAARPGHEAGYPLSAFRRRGTRAAKGAAREPARVGDAGARRPQPQREAAEESGVRNRRIVRPARWTDQQRRAFLPDAGWRDHRGTVERHDWDQPEGTALSAAGGPAA